MVHSICFFPLKYLYENCAEMRARVLGVYNVVVLASVIHLGWGKGR